MRIIRTHALPRLSLEGSGRCIESQSGSQPLGFVASFTCAISVFIRAGAVVRTSVIMATSFDEESKSRIHRSVKATNVSNSVTGFGPDSEDFVEMLLAAKSGDTETRGRLLQWYSNYLSVLASTQLDQRLRRRVNPSDLVQETMLAAHRDFGGFRGASQPELLGWLRKILINTLHRTVATHVGAGKRDIRREISIDQASARLDESACTMAATLPSQGESPSAPMRARERSVEFANQLSQLKPDYRDVIVMRVLQGLSFEEIGQRMDRTSGATRMLWLRALDHFKAHALEGGANALETLVRGEISEKAPPSKAESTDPSPQDGTG